MTFSPATVLVSDDDDGIRLVLARAFKDAGIAVHTYADATSLLEDARNGRGDVVITDLTMPGMSGHELISHIKSARADMPVIVISAHRDFANMVKASENGAIEYIAKPFDVDAVVKMAKTLAESQARLQPAANKDTAAASGLIGESDAMRAVFHTIARMTHSEHTTLITGESGTGKEVVARTIHAHSPRKNKRFVAVNMAALPKDLIESELFGHEKGAFTGAAARKTGRFESANGGTLFLDEIGDMPLDLQTRLLRVLQERTLTRIGGADDIPVDVRIIAATNRDLTADVADGRFRQDLYYRLNVIPLHLPPLRDRGDDIHSISSHILSKHKIDKTLTPAALSLLHDYKWPGNVRELENLLLRISVTFPQHKVDAEDIRPLLNPSPHAVTGHGVKGGDLSASVDMLSTGLLAQKSSHGKIYEMALAAMEEPLLKNVMHHTKGNQIKAADILGINRNTLRKKLSDLGLRSGRDNGQEND